ncbi:hypothetical protein V8D89_012390 [Ganoderma adspersum]
MSPIQFKFSKPPDGLVRRVTFPERPSWETLAIKIQSLYDIPLPSIGVSYVDNDGDEVTLSSEDELQDFYQSLLPGKDSALILVRLNVRDLDSLRSDKPLPDTPRTGSAMNYRNTFGRSAPVLFEMEVEDGWQPIPSGLGGVYVGGQPTAFVEVLDSDADITQFNNRDKDTSSTSSDSTDTLPEIIPTPTTHKGKGRARSVSDCHSLSPPDTISSTQSVVAAESGPKHPIHVFAMKNSSTGTFRRGGSRSRSVSVLGPRTPTPKIRTPTSAAEKPSGTAQDDDPPLPDLDNMGGSQPHIANDVANLFDTLSTILSSHPELSDGIRTVVRNASNGSYWQTHRDQVVRAAEEIRRSVIAGADEVRHAANDGRRTAEEAAGRRVADALAEVIRVIADITGNTQPADPNAESSSGPGFETSTPMRPADGNPFDGPRMRPPGPPPLHRGGHGRMSWASFDSRWGGFPFSGPPPFAPFPPGSRPTGRPPGPPPPPPLGPPPPPGLPPPPGAYGPFGGRGYPNDYSPDRNLPGLPPHFHGRFGRPPFGPHFHRHQQPGEWDNDDPFVGGPRGGHHFGGWNRHRYHDANWADTVPALPPRPNADDEDVEVTMYGASPLESPDAAKKKLQAAKEAYVTEKEKYRRAREERKKRRMNVSTDSETKDVHDSPIDPPAAQEPVAAASPSVEAAPPVASQPPQAELAPQIISNARGPFPQLELYSVPRRSHTIHGTGHRRDASWGTFGSMTGMGPTQGGRAAAVESIVHRLREMGFSANEYPVLKSKVDAHIPLNGEVSKEREESIVTAIVNELLPASPGAQQPSGSGVRRA